MCGIYSFNFLFNIILHRLRGNSALPFYAYILLFVIYFSFLQRCDLQNYTSDHPPPASRRLVPPASALSHPSSATALRRLLILYVHEPSRSLWPHNVGRKKDPAHCGGIHRGPEFRISSQSACCVNTDWTRPGVACSRLRPIYRLFAVSSLSGARERPRRRRRRFLGDPGSWCWWSVANPAPGPDSNDSRMVPSRTTLFWDLPRVPNARWSRRSVEGIARNRTPCSVYEYPREKDRERILRSREFSRV